MPRLIGVVRVATAFCKELCGCGGRAHLHHPCALGKPAYKDLPLMTSAASAPAKRDADALHVKGRLKRNLGPARSARSSADRAYRFELVVAALKERAAQKANAKVGPGRHRKLGLALTRVDNALPRLTIVARDDGAVELAAGAAARREDVVCKLCRASRPPPLLPPPRLSPPPVPLPGNPPLLFPPGFRRRDIQDAQGYRWRNASAIM